MTRWIPWGVVVLVACAACAGAAPPPEAPPPKDPEPTAPSEPTTAVDVPTEAELDAMEEELDEEEPGSAPGQATDDGTGEGEANAPREVVYKMTPAGLVVEVEGMSFVVTAEAVRRAGKWAVKVKAEASAIDDAEHSLLTPENGPLAFAAEVKKGAKVETTNDTRSGDDEQIVTSGAPLELEREFPPKGDPGLGRGESVKLRTGLWGIGKLGGRRRPLKKLAIVQMVVGQGTPKPHVNPPE